ncbi:hypothetical protein GDO81_024448 [Engystomops pustulosus]|uniref:Uncharacterized protein n=1 Tax=Engystomops pustulosus TaxID=76066 RepID=A0AAV6YLD8_ENGPU|nr:hypothetical protein GDO81_024448 [Engystomops pustulosus]
MYMKQAPALGQVTIRFHKGTNMGHGSWSSRLGPPAYTPGQAFWGAAGVIRPFRNRTNSSCENNEIFTRVRDLLLVPPDAPKPGGGDKRGGVVLPSDAIGHLHEGGGGASGPLKEPAQA